MSNVPRRVAETAEECGLKHDKESIYGTWRGYSVIMDNFDKEDECPHLWASVSHGGERPDKDDLEAALKAVGNLDKDKVHVFGTPRKPFGGCGTVAWMVSANVTLTTGDMVEQLPLLLDAFTQTLERLGLQNCDSARGTIGPTQIYRINGDLRILNEESFQHKVELAAKGQRLYAQTSENYLAGICGAVMATLVVGIVYYLLRGLTKGALIAFPFAGIAAELVYERLSHRESLVGYLCAALVPIPVDYVCIRAFYSRPLMDKWDLGWAEAFMRLPAGISEGLVSKYDYMEDLLICALFLAINAGLCVSLYRRWRRYHDTAEKA